MTNPCGKCTLVPQPEPQRYNWQASRWGATCAPFCYEFQRRGERMNPAIKTTDADYDL